MNSHRKTHLLLLTVLLISACASTTQIDSRYQQTPSLIAGQSLLLAARTPEADIRRQWETLCADKLARQGFSTTVSHRQLPDWQDADIGALVNWSQQHDHDLILVAELTGLLLKAADTLGEPAVGEGRQDVSGQIITLDKDYQRERKAEPISQDVELALHRADGKPLWTGVARTREANEIRAIARSQCRALADHLKTLGLPSSK